MTARHRVYFVVMKSMYLVTWWRCSWNNKATRMIYYNVILPKDRSKTLSVKTEYIYDIWQLILFHGYIFTIFIPSTDNWGLNIIMTCTNTCVNLITSIKLQRMKNGHLLTKGDYKHKLDTNTHKLQCVFFNRGKSQYIVCISRHGISIIMTRRSRDSLILIMGIPNLERRYLYIKITPCRRQHSYIVKW